MKRAKNKGYEVREGTIVLKRSLTRFDTFVKKFLDVLKRYSDYMVVSGFVSVSTGRVRATEDVDVLVPVMKKGSSKGSSGMSRRTAFGAFRAIPRKRFIPAWKTWKTYGFPERGKCTPTWNSCP